MSKILTEEKTITSCNDFELNIDRPQKLTYNYSYPESEKLKGIVFIIQGFGGSPEYMNNLREFIAKEFSVVAVDVYYHCFFSRLENGASVEFDNIDLHILQDFIDTYKIDFSDVKDINTSSIINSLNKKIGTLKASNIFKSDYKLKLPTTIIPKNNEYQNFGMMQAIDHINVLLDLEKMPFDFADDYSVSLMGSSHGGYLAHLIAKLAPHKIDSVIDNSCYVKPPINYFLGKETNILNPEYVLLYEHLQLDCFVQTLWTTNTKSKNLFTTNHYRIRNLNDSIQIDTMPMLSKNRTKYTSYHSTQDGIAKINDKIILYKKLNDLGFETKLNIIDSETKIDGKFIKTLTHGMGMSLKELSRRELPKAIQNAREQHDEDITISYKCDSITYRFIYKNKNLKIELF